METRRVRGHGVALGRLAGMNAPRRRRRRVDDPAALPIPMSGLFADLELGVGHVSLPDEFFGSSNATQVEVIADWQRALDEVRLRALARFYRELDAMLKDLPERERLARFRTVCSSLDIDCPDDLKTLLDRS
jgi:hypothetical protein